MATHRTKPPAARSGSDYRKAVEEVAALLESARRTSARAVNAVMTATYWEIGRRIVDLEQGGETRAEYGGRLIERLSADLTERFGRGFSERNLTHMRQFYRCWAIPQTVSAEFKEVGSKTKKVSARPIPQTLSAELGRPRIRRKASAEPMPPAPLGPVMRFPLPWSHYVRLLSVESEQARRFYETESLRNGWSVRQLDRQIASRFYERTLLSRDKGAMLRKGAAEREGDRIAAEDEIKDPFILEFLDLKDEYSEDAFEDALIAKLETFLMELGGDFAFIGRQRRLRIGDEWYRIDLLFFHRGLRCLVVIDLKIGKFTHADAGQMHMYLNYAREHWMREGENPPVGLILCAQKDEAVARYSLDNLPNKVMAREYRLALPKEKELAAELEKTRRAIEARTRTPAKTKRTSRK